MFNYDRMNELIKKSGKTKLFLCGRLGKGKTYLRDAEKQKTNISGETLRILASELNTTPEYLTGETDTPQKQKNTTLSGDVDAELREIWSTADDEERRVLLEMARMLKSRRNPR